MAMINYYEKLNLNAAMSVEEINSKLDAFESVWNQRMMQDPAKADEMLTMINEARTVFSSSEGKIKYDHSLAAGDTASEDSRLQEFTKWLEAARGYANDHQYDLARASIEKASKYYMDSDENADYLCFAADIYRNNKEYSTALKLINEAILLKPKNAYYYFVKGFIYVCSNNSEEARKCYTIAVELSVNPTTKRIYLTVLSQTYLYGLRNYSAAEKTINEAVALGDDSDLTRQILAELKKPQEIAPERLRDCLYSEYQKEPVEQKDEIVSLAENIIANMKTLGVSTVTIKGGQGDGRMEEVYRGDDERCRCIYSVVLEDSGFWCLYGTLNRRTGDNTADLGTERTRKVYGQLPDIPDDLLREFDFNGSVSFSDHHVYGLIEKLQYYYTDDSSHKQTRLQRIAIRKGDGLLSRLNKIKNEQADAAKTKQEAERLRQEKEKLIAERKQNGRCLFCGGEFKGFLFKKCTQCGKNKNY